jgi:cupin 2 domain-containing protein
MEVKNIFSSIPESIPDELFERLVGTEGILIERIVSCNHSSPDGFWYEQERNEWVLVLQGSAGLLFEGNGEAVTLKTGDWIEIPARVKHRVEWTDPVEKTVWLAVHY